MTFHTAFLGAVIIATVFIGSALVVDYTASCNGFGGGVRIVLGTPCR